MRQVEIPHDYFLNMSRKDYSSIEMALVREFIQNSIDAGAKQIFFDFDKENNVMTVFDDGHGMTEDIILNKLLCLGKSHKETKNAVGAFGHAKLLLYFSWEKWEIHSLDNYVKGNSHFFDIRESEHIDGTISSIKLDKSIDINHLISTLTYFVEDCELNCAIKYSDGTDNVSLLAEKKREKTIYEDENVIIYTNSHKSHYAIVRQNGVKMFSVFLSKSDTTPIIEIKKSPYEMFLQNRDYFRKPYDDVISELTKQLSTDSVDSFTMNNSQTEITNRLVNNNEVSFYNMTEKDIDKLFKLKRNRRYINIVHAYYDYMKKHVSLPDIKFGFICDNRVHGLAKGDFRVFINPDSIKIHSPNYRKMSVILLNIMIHEIAHILTYDKHCTMSHDESFSKERERLVDIFWDSIPFTNIFKKVWKETL